MRQFPGSQAACSAGVTARPVVALRAPRTVRFGAARCAAAARLATGLRLARGARFFSLPGPESSF